MSLYLGNTPIAVSGSSRNIGEIIQSTIPLTDAGLHLLDGALISGAGSYSAFVTYISGLVSNYPDLFITETAWQQAVTDYGVCGKFVYDSTNNTVRLPKITGFTEGTTDVTALGDLVEAGLPKIQLSGKLPTYISSGGYAQLATGSSVTVSDSNINPIYGNSTTVQPQAIKVLYYIVIANSVKTNIEVDIDEIMTDLNGKADVDGSNMISSVKKFDGQWVKAKQLLTTSTAIGTYNLDLSSYLPNDNYNYEVLISGECYSSSATYSALYIESQLFPKMLLANVGVNARTMIINSLVPVGRNRTLTLTITKSVVTWESWDEQQGLYAVSYRRVGTNE